MKILQLHNFYREPGGEDRAFAAEYALLRGRGHTVEQFTVSNEEIQGLGGNLGIAAKAIWNSATASALAGLIERFSPDVVHAHNTFPLISPSAFYAAKRAGVPIVQTLHNYRLLCPAATFFREGRVCEACISSAVPYRAVVHRCYRASALASAAVASMLTIHRALGTWQTAVTAFVATSEFARRMFIAGGLPEKKLFVKANGLASDSGPGEGRGGYAVFAGRLSREKGVELLARAWPLLGARVPLKILGNGPLSDVARQLADNLPSVEWLGHCEHERVIRLLKEASMLVFPSECYENSPMAIVEAFACGTPVIAPAFGSTNEMIVDGTNGFHFRPGNAEDLAEKIGALARCGDASLQFRNGARKTFLEYYAPEPNYEALMRVYREARLFE